MKTFSKLKDILVLSNYIRLGDVYKKCVIHVNYFERNDQTIVALYLFDCFFVLVCFACLVSTCLACKNDYK